MYKLWIDEWGFTPEAIQEACRETTKGTPTMAYLNGILMRQHQLGRHEVQALEAGMQKEKEARDFARDVYAGLGRTGITPSQDDLAAISAWREQGASDELIDDGGFGGAQTRGRRQHGRCRCVSAKLASARHEHAGCCSS